MYRKYHTTDLLNVTYT